MQACASPEKFTSYWNPQNDNNYNSFTEREALYYQSDDQISIRVFNNNRFVDVILETNSPITLRKIYNLGLSLWIDPKGKSRNVYGVNYPLPIQFPYTGKQFKSYLNGFIKEGFQEELIDRFQAYELVDTRMNKMILTSTREKDETVKVELKTTDQVLFSYHIQIPINIIFPTNVRQKEISIGISSVNEPDEEYYSAMSSKQVVQKKIDALKAGSHQSKHELEEWWVNFILAED